MAAMQGLHSHKADRQRDQADLHRGQADLHCGKANQQRGKADREIQADPTSPASQTIYNLTARVSCITSRT